MRVDNDPPNHRSTLLLSTPSHLLHSTPLPPHPPHLPLLSPPTPPTTVITTHPSIPGDFLIMRYSFFKLLGADATSADDYGYFGGTFFLLGISTFLACLIQLYASTSDSLSMILDLTGGVSGSMVSFILPGLMAMRLLSTDAETYLRGLVLVIFGSLIPVLVLLSKLMQR